jgi:hypothetical protein
MTASQTDREKWLAIVLAGALDHDIINPDDIFAHVTPDVLAAHLPPDVMSNVLASSLRVGRMTAEVLLNAAGPEILSRHIPPGILWAAVQDAAQRAAIPG